MIETHPCNTPLPYFDVNRLSDKPKSCIHTTLCCTTLHYTTLHYTTRHYVMLQYITLRHITLLCINYITLYTVCVCTGHMDTNKQINTYIHIYIYVDVYIYIYIIYNEWLYPHYIPNSYSIKSPRFVANIHMINTSFPGINKRLLSTKG